jgi:Ca2+-binding RTX toxin-like protein
MKPYINFLIFLVVAVSLYTAYGLITFRVDEPREFVFNEPKIPTELILMDETNDTPEGKTKVLAVDEAQKAIDYYTTAQAKAPQQANDTIALLVDRMTNSGLPLYFLSAPTPQAGGLRNFETLKINTDSVIDPSTAETKPNLNCSSKTPAANIVLGTSDKDNISCDANRDVTGVANDPDVFFIGGPEDDQIVDAVGNRVVNGGTGNDVIKLGAGRSIIILDASWGHDTLTVDCNGAMVEDNQITKGFPIPWVHKTTNFIVFGSSLNPSDVEWRGNVLTHKITGDTLTVNENCFTTVPKIQ